MCGIFGYVGPQSAIDICLSGLKRLEYRGYDSAGIAGQDKKGLYISKEVGKVKKLEDLVSKDKKDLNLAIAHTRWATHGAPSHVNAHPHTNTAADLAIVHNGIIENHDSLRKHLIEDGFQIVSDTDTELVAHLIEKHYEGDLLKAIQAVIPLLEGSFSLAVIHKDQPKVMLAVANESPLVVGLGNNEMFLASDTHAFLTHTSEVVYLHDGEIAVIQAETLEVYDETMEQVQKKSETLEHSAQEAEKGDFEHFTLKEIFEQPQTLRNALLSRYLEDEGNGVLEGMNIDADELLDVERILILACGTSWHAGYVAAYMLEDKARIPTQVEISSEFRYKNPIVPDGTLVIAISQSGETADTIAAVRELKAKGAKILGICNVHGSTLAREAHGCLFLRAGIEIGVCSTKAFTSQLAVLSLLTLHLARMRDMSRDEGRTFVQALKALPLQLEKVLEQNDFIASLAKKYAMYDNFFFLGRLYMYPTSLEGALKLKEISYINANGYPAGEMKHGPIALINDACPTIALCANKMTFDKMLSNIHEVRARKGPVLAIVEEGQNGLENVADDIITVPQTIDELASIPTVVAMQLFAYHVAKERGTEIDQPRNLAKSVTVE
jgi:glucosamine--fructose-6-phosphate aminotransferase (isomerizing)